MTDLTTCLACGATEDVRLREVPAARGDHDALVKVPLCQECCDMSWAEEDSDDDDPIWDPGIVAEADQDWTRINQLLDALLADWTSTAADRSEYPDVQLNSEFALKLQWITLNGQDDRDAYKLLAAAVRRLAL